MSWSHDEVRRASQEWVWAPPGSKRVEVAGRMTLLVSPGRSVHVAWSSDTDPEGSWHLLKDVAAEHDAPSLTWTTTDDQPALEGFLVARGGELRDITEIMARELPAAPIDSPASLRCVLVDTEQTIRDAAAVATRVWGGTMPADEDVHEQLREASRPLDERSGFQVVAYLDGVPASTGGVTKAGPVARLWGACTTPELRGRGAYRANTATRLAIAVELGCTLALANALVDTSAPILARLRFTSYGQKRTYRVASR